MKKSDILKKIMEANVARYSPLRVLPESIEVIKRVVRGQLYEIFTDNGTMLVKVTHFYKSGVRCQALSRPECHPARQRKLDFTVPYHKVSHAKFLEKKHEDAPLYIGNGTDRMTRYFKNYDGPLPD